MRSAGLFVALGLLSSCTRGSSDDDEDHSDNDDLPSDTDEPPPGVTTVRLSNNPRMVLEKRFAIQLASGIPSATLECTSPDDPLEDHRLEFTGPSGELRLYGLLADTAYSCTLSDGDTELWSGDLRTDPLPEGLPELLVSGDAARASMDDGYVLFNHWTRGPGAEGVHRVVLVDNEARVRWYVALLDASLGGIVARWLGDGRVLIGCGDTINPGFYNLSGEVLFDVGPPAPNEVYHHEALLTPEGYIVSLQSIDGLVTGPDDDYVGFRIEATDPASGAKVWTFDSTDAVEAGTLPAPPPDEKQAFHANALSWLNDDPLGPSVWVSMRAINTIARIDRATGEVTAKFGPQLGIALQNEAGDPLPLEEWFWTEHAPVIEDGNVITVFDNGTTRPGVRYSRIATFSYDEPDRATLLWEWTQPNWFEPDFGSVQFLADRHVVIGSGHCIDCPPDNDLAFVLEVDPLTGDVVWRYDFAEPADTIYRAEAVDRCAFPNLRYCPL